MQISVEGKGILQNWTFISKDIDFACCHLVFIAVGTTPFVLHYCRAIDDNSFPLGVGKQ